MSQAELGAFLGVNQGMAGRYIRGSDKPKGQRLETIAEIFGVCQEWLLTGRGPKVPGRSEDDVLDMTGLSSEQKAVLRQLRDTLTQRKAGNDH
jgi:transcriptional regulator with XRE-family HTH domain